VGQVPQVRREREGIGMGSWDKYGDYNGYLQSPEWNALRGVILRQAEYKCQICSGDSQLQVHHRSYGMGDREDGRNLVVLCDKCHQLYELGGKYLQATAQGIRERYYDTVKKFCYIETMVDSIFEDNGILNLYSGRDKSIESLYDFSYLELGDIDVVIKIFKAGYADKDDYTYNISLEDATNIAGVSFKKSMSTIKNMIMQTIIGATAQLRNDNTGECIGATLKNGGMAMIKNRRDTKNVILFFDLMDAIILSKRLAKLARMKDQKA